MNYDEKNHNSTRRPPTRWRCIWCIYRTVVIQQRRLSVLESSGKSDIWKQIQSCWVHFQGCLVSSWMCSWYQNSLYKRLEWHFFETTLHVFDGVQLWMYEGPKTPHLILGSAYDSRSDPSHGSTCALKITCGGTDFNNWCPPLRRSLSLESPLMTSSEGARRPPGMENHPYLGHAGSFITLILTFLLILRVEIRLHRHKNRQFWSFPHRDEWFWGPTRT